MVEGVYKNSTELMNVHGVPFYMSDIVDICLEGKLNLFLKGDTGSGKTQLARDAMNLFGAGVGNASYAANVRGARGMDNKGNIAISAAEYFQEDKTLFVLGRNDMDTRELFKQINFGKLPQKRTYDLEHIVNPDTGEVEWYYPRFDNGTFVYHKLSEEQARRVKSSLEGLAGTSADAKELTSKIKANLFVVDELPNCVPAVRNQLFNMFDGFIEIDGKTYPFGNGYSIGIATGNIGQEFTESSNDLGRALKDRMHITVDLDYFFPTPGDTLEIYSGNINPRVDFSFKGEDKSEEIIKRHEALMKSPIPLEKLLIVNYLIQGLDNCSKGSKRRMKDSWPTSLTDHEQGSDVGLVKPLSGRAPKSILAFSQALDEVAIRKGASREVVEAGKLNSMLQAYKFVSAHSGVLNEAAVRNKYDGDHYKAMDAVISKTTARFRENSEAIGAGLEMVESGETDEKVLSLYQGRWAFMRDTLKKLSELNKESNS